MEMLLGLALALGGLWLAGLGLRQKRLERKLSELAHRLESLNREEPAESRDQELEVMYQRGLAAIMGYGLEDAFNKLMEG